MSEADGKNHFEAIHDVNKNEWVKITHVKQIESLNKDGYGIFASVNKFGERRKKEFVTSIDYFFVDLDNGTKEEQKEIISNCLTPTQIVETGRGFHLYWKVKNNMLAELGKEDAIKEYEEIEKLIINFCNGDQNAADITRLLRVPKTYHMKSAPFLVDIVYSSDNRYTHRHMRLWLKEIATKGKKTTPSKAMLSPLKKNNQNSDFWTTINAVNSTETLKRISGHPCVNGETFTFNPRKDGGYQIVVNGKPSSCWIDLDGKIGSTSGGGPTIVNWINWYQKDMAATAKIIKEMFPEIKEFEIELGFK